MNQLKKDTLPQSDRDLAVAPAETRDAGTEIALLLVKAGVLSEKQLSYATRIRSKLNSQKPLIQVLRELSYFREEQLRSALANSRIPVKLGSLLVELGYLREADLRSALSIQKNSAESKKLGEILLENHFIAENKLLEALAYQLGFPNLEPEFAHLDKQLLRKTNPRWCRQHCLIPIRVENGRVLVAFADPRDARARQETEQIFGANVAPAIASKRGIKEAIAAFERSLKQSPQQVTTQESSPVDLVNALIVEALKANASDVHIEPMREHLRVRFRCDGVLMPFRDLDNNLAPAIISRLKVLANADITEKRRHQDGRIMFEDPTSGQNVDIRLSFYVTIHGEKVVLRLLSRKAHLLAVEEIGLPPKVLERFFHDVLDVPSGVIMITGPTGSGKTTTLYSCINYLNDIERSIITAEDPVEYIVDGIGQCSLNSKIDVTFETTLPAMVRQDPDVIVLGEIRDTFSADAAIQAALTGHKVLTTFHTEDTIGGLLRLMNMNIETFLISSTVVSVLAQRLVRQVCPNCSEPYQPNSTELQRLGCKQADLAGAVFKSGHGCSHCRYTGYQGRMGVYELLILNEMVKDAILNKKTSYEIRRVSIETSGMITLLEDGIAKAAQGRTTISEVLRHLPRLDKPRPFNEIRRLIGI